MSNWNVAAVGAFMILGARHSLTATLFTHPVNSVVNKAAKLWGEIQAMGCRGFAPAHR